MATLYRKYRSKTFDEIIGQESVVSILKKQLQNDTLPHALLFTGPRGTGKTSLARIVAKALNCTKRREDGNPCKDLETMCPNCLAILDGRFEDLIEIDAASNRGIEEIRQIKENINLLPLKSKRKIYIIDEAHMLTREAFNALLKVLEEPPEHILFMMCTTEYNKVPATILSRCEKLELNLAPLESLIKKLQLICESEGVNVEEKGLEVVAEAGNGSFRDSETLLEKIVSNNIGNKNIVTEAEVRETLGMPPSQIISEFIQGMAERNSDVVLQSLGNVKNISAGEFLKLIVNELVKDFVKYNELIKLILRLEQDIRYTQHGFIVIKSRVLDWCGIEGGIPELRPSIQRPVLSHESQNIHTPEKVQPVQIPASQMAAVPVNAPLQNTAAAITGDFKSGWKNILTEVSQKNKPLSFILNSAEVEKIGDNKIQLRVKIRLHKDLLEKNTAKDLITNLYEKYMGAKPLIEVILTSSITDKPILRASKKAADDDVNLDEIFN